MHDAWHGPYLADACRLGGDSLCYVAVLGVTCSLVGADYVWLSPGAGKSLEFVRRCLAMRCCRLEEAVDTITKSCPSASRPSFVDF
jgi:hypothetical protein